MSDAPPPAGRDWQNEGKQFISGLSLGGKILLGAALLGLLSSFLPYYSVSFKLDAPGLKMQSGGSSFIATQVWQGIVALIGFALAGAGVFMLATGKGNLPRQNVLYATLGGAAVACVMAIWLFSQTGSSASGEGISAGRAFGGYLHILAGIGALVGGGMFAKEQKLF